MHISGEAKKKGRKELYLKCDVLVCANEVGRKGDLCEDCTKKYHSDEYFVVCCERCNALVCFMPKENSIFDKKDKVLYQNDGCAYCKKINIMNPDDFI